VIVSHHIAFSHCGRRWKLVKMCKRQHGWQRVKRPVSSLTVDAQWTHYYRREAGNYQEPRPVCWFSERVGGTTGRETERETGKCDLSSKCQQCEQRLMAVYVLGTHARILCVCVQVLAELKSEDLFDALITENGLSVW